MLLHRHQLLIQGRTDKVLLRDVTRGELTRVTRGWYMSTTNWQNLLHTDRHLVRAICAHKDARTTPVFSHFTAAAILGFPLLNFDTSKPHVLLPASSSRQSTGNVVRHHQNLAPHELQQSNGLLHTNASRTLADLARTTPFEFGVVCGDAAIRHLMQRTGLTLEQQREQLLADLSARPTWRGTQRARNVLHFLDSGGQSPLESISRIQLVRLGFNVRTQTPVPAPNGGFYRMDIELLGRRIFFEADGKVKYLDEAYMNGRSIDEVVVHEKERENWVVGTVPGYRVLRGGWEHVQTTETLKKRLLHFNVTPPGRAGKELLHLH